MKIRFCQLLARLILKFFYFWIEINAWLIDRKFAENNGKANVMPIYHISVLNYIRLLCFTNYHYLAVKERFAFVFYFLAAVKRNLSFCFFGHDFFLNS